MIVERSVYTVGSVPYLNARPLVDSLERTVEPDVEVLYDVPSKLPAMLDTGRAQAVLVSSIEALTRPGAKVAGGVCIGSIGEVMSVRLFCRRPIFQVETLALDASSMTSNILAQIVLGELFHVAPRTISLEPNLEAMLQRCDGALLIGDSGMRASGDGLHVLDLGSAWHDLTGLPFVWAMWIGGDGLSVDLSARLATAKEAGTASLDRIVDDEVLRSGWDRLLCDKYLKSAMSYDLSDKHLAGLREFGRLAEAHGLIRTTSMPEIVGTDTTSMASAR